jgi:hypothetical protein
MRSILASRVGVAVSVIVGVTMGVAVEVALGGTVAVWLGAVIWANSEVKLRVMLGVTLAVFDGTIPGTPKLLITAYINPPNPIKTNPANAAPLRWTANHTISFPPHPSDLLLAISPRTFSNRRNVSR